MIPTEKSESSVSLIGYYEYECSEPECRKVWLYPGWQGKFTLFSGGTGARCLVCGAGLAFVRRVVPKPKEHKCEDKRMEDLLTPREMLVVLREIRDALHEIRDDVREMKKRAETPVNITATIANSRQWD